jgi:hypothetical protein
MMEHAAHFYILHLEFYILHLKHYNIHLKPLHLKLYINQPFFCALVGAAPC